MVSFALFTNLICKTPTCCITQQGRGRNMKKHLLHYRESNPTKTIMENQCYSHEPHWELSKKEVKNVFHYEESNLEKTIMEINAILTDCVE